MGAVHATVKLMAKRPTHSPHVRIVAGAWRSRVLAVPPPTHTRPVPQRMRKAVFDILGSHFATPGNLPPVRAADMFAGSGSMGFEALSRGAQHCDFFDRRSGVYRVLRDNCRVLGAEPHCRIIRADAWTVCLATPRPPQTYDLVFIDPPYRDARDTSARGRVVTLLSDLRRASWVDQGSIAVIHHEDFVQYGDVDVRDWRLLTVRQYGTGVVTLFEYATPDRGTGDAPEVAPGNTRRDGKDT